MAKEIEGADVLESAGLDLSGVATHAPGPQGLLPLTPEMLLTQPSGNLFGLSMNVGMGWEPQRLGGPEVLILSTHGGLRAEDGKPIALQSWLFQHGYAWWLEPRDASLLFALTFVLFWYGILWLLYRKQIFIKL